MTTTSTATAPQVLTYEQYLAEPVVARRYDIIDGVRVFMSGPSWRHQRIQRNVARVLDRYEEQTGSGYVVAAPFDILIRRVPALQTRQPDVFFSTRLRLDQGGGIPNTGPLEVPPELVVEIISDSETAQRRASKLADYIAIGVDEAWIVHPGSRSVDTLRLLQSGTAAVASFDDAQTLHSPTFPDLAVVVAEFFLP